ncbi:hypothetical protein EGW08_021255 [Elysia chlorotica]|uniref:Uncharacterized protein n=1 Tax=Elysia chlorotica TaxID=188477 RepID=A0A3S0Z5A1_ELYCH|nr:hypothetical protein EGW08_021255 [Elysia chlorotica]
MSSFKSHCPEKGSNFTNLLLFLLALSAIPKFNVFFIYSTEKQLCVVCRLSYMCFLANQNLAFSLFTRLVAHQHLTFSLFTRLVAHQHLTFSLFTRLRSSFVLCHLSYMCSSANHNLTFSLFTGLRSSFVLYVTYLSYMCSSANQNLLDLRQTNI